MVWERIHHGGDAWERVMAEDTRLTQRLSNDREEPFGSLKLSSWEPLKGVSRAPCARCGCSRKFYCYDCYEIVGLEPHTVPRVQLPVKVNIIKHPREVPGKSTATHARVLAPEFVSIYLFPDVPVYPDLSSVILVYPKEDALTVRELISQLTEKQLDVHGCSDSVWRGLTRVVFIDSTWAQTKEILRHKAIRSLPCVKLTAADTHFWRPNGALSGNFLATIEAVYYFFREMEAAISDRPYTGQYDDLLYFYAYQYQLVQQAQRERGLMEDQSSQRS